MTERWLTIPRFPSHEVSDLGRVRNARTGLVRKPAPSDSRYPRVRINMRGVAKSVLGHKAVLEAFVGRAPSRRHRVAHEDGDKTNCRLLNLSWKLARHNEADKRRHGTAPRGFSGHKRSDHVPAVREMLARRMSYTCIGRVVGLHRSSVSRIARGLRRRVP